MKNKIDEYLLGLDVGTGSVGWAVTDAEYNLARFNGKDLWGVRLFETAETAEDRRLHRGARRRLERRNKRIALLQELFAEEISKVDPGFFVRLKESAYLKEDKSSKQLNSLFNDADYTDKDFYKEYPTIHHLIKALIEKKAKKDIRLLYLACHNIVKKRGHFLFAGNDFSTDSQFGEALFHLEVYLKDYMEIDLYFDVEKTQEILTDKELNLTQKRNRLETILNLDKKDKQKIEIVKLIVGANYNFATLFDDEELKEESPKDCGFSRVDFEAKVDEYREILEDKLDLILHAKAVYNASVLASLLDDESYLSYAKVKVYEKHKADLELLKKFVKENYDKETFYEIFKDPKVPDNYCAYVGMCKKNNRKIVIQKKADQEVFYKFIRKVLNKDLKKNTDYQNILNEIELKNFLPKQIDKNNSEIPYQLRMAELDLILKNYQEEFPFLNKKDEQGYSTEYKIKKLLTFKIPYYIGIVNDANKEKYPDRCWVVKKDNALNTKITPWNFFDIVDEQKTAEAFINVRTNKCTYLIGEDVLSRHSLLYSEFTVLNEINNLKINVNGREVFDLTLKKRIYNDHFKNQKVVSKKSIERFLKREGICSKDDSVLIAGIDEECTSSLSFYYDLKKIFGDDIDNQTTKKMIEDIILWSTIYDEGDGKEILKEKILQNYSNSITKDQIKKVLNLKFSGWGRLSSKFLTEISSEFLGFPEKINLITALRETNLNLMELLSKDYGFSKEIEKFNSEFDESDSTFSYKNLVKDLYVSPSVKRMIWQTLKITNELKKITKKDPDKIFIEMARGSEAEKGRTKSRKTNLTQLYDNCKKQKSHWLEEINFFTESLKKTDNVDLRSDQLYFYYTQLGKCMYCGKSFDIESIFNKSINDIDHIYPQSKIKDDSLNNRVLVCKTCNAKKGDSYPLSTEIQTKQAEFWRFLHTAGFITNEKLFRLTRKTELSYDEIGQFVARQLVETSQATKVIGQILEKEFPESKIVYAKARNVSTFRNKYNIVKYRDINDAHHAHDAYLNIVVGNVYYTKFTRDPRNFIKGLNYSEKQSFNFERVFDYDVERNNKIAWEKDKTIDKVKAVLKKNTILYTRHSFIKSGGFFDQNILKKGKGQMSIKADDVLSDMSKYGAYNKVSAAYYILIEHQKGKNRIRTLEVVPLYLVKKIKKDISVLNDYIKNDLELKEYRIIIPKIKINSLLKIDGFYYNITGKAGNQFLIRSAVQFYTDNNTVLFFKRIAKFQEIQSNKKDFTSYQDYTLRMYVKGSIGKNDKDIITKDEFDIGIKNRLLEVYDGFYQKYKSSIYKNRINSKPLSQLNEKRESFINLLIEEQIYSILEMLKFFRPINQAINLQNIGGKKGVGEINLGKNFSNLKECILINQSVTGVFENRQDLLKL